MNLVFREGANIGLTLRQAEESWSRTTRSYFMNEPKVTSSEESEYVRAFFEARKADFTYENGMVRAQGDYRETQEKADAGDIECAFKVGLEFYIRYIGEPEYVDEPWFRPVSPIFLDAAIHYFKIAAPSSEKANGYLYVIIEEKFEEWSGDELFEIAQSMECDEFGNRDYLLGKICLLKHDITFLEYHSGLVYLYNSKNCGNVNAMMLLGKIYEEGYSRAGIQALGQDYGIAYRYYKKAAQNGSCEAKLICAQWCMEGKGCAANQVRAYYWFDDAARNTMTWSNTPVSVFDDDRRRWRIPNLKLAEFYVSGAAFPPDYAVALTIMLMVQNTLFVPEVTPYIDSLKAKLTRKQIRDVEQAIAAKGAVEYSVSHSSYSSLLPDPDEYLTNHPFPGGSQEPAPFLTVQMPETPKESDPESVKPVSPENSTDQASASSTKSKKTKAYKFASKHEADFDISKISLTLKVGHKLAKTEELDYTSLVIKYDDKDKDEKKASIYESIRVNLKARKLLFCLACQSNQKDRDKYSASLKQLLDKADGEDCSRLNDMLKKMFPDCPIPNKSGMIRKKKHTINIALKTNTGDNWTGCSDCKECKLNPWLTA